MGDGGVTLAPSQLVLEMFPISESICAGNSGVFQEKSFKPVKSMKGSERVEELSKIAELGSEKGFQLDESSKELVNHRREKGIWDKEFSRNGELESGEFVSGKEKKGALDKGESFLEKSRNGEVELGEFIPDRAHKVEGVQDKWSKSKLDKIDDRWKRNGEKADSGSGRSWKGDLDKGEVTAERWRRGDNERSPYRKKDASRNEDQRKRDSSKGIDKAHERDSKKSSRVSEEESRRHKFESSNGKSRDKEHHTESWSKRHCKESEISGNHKYHAEANDHLRSKGQRKSEESSRPAYPERIHGNSSSSSFRVSSSSRHSSRLHESFHSSHHRQGRSPGCLERSTHEKPRHGEHMERTPLHSDRSPRERSGLLCHRDHTPNHPERSPLERGRRNNHRDRAPGSERSPRDRSKTVDHRELCRKRGESDKLTSSRYEEAGEWRDSGKDICSSASVRHSIDGSCVSDKTVNDSFIFKKELPSPDREHLDLPPPPPLPRPPPLPSMPSPLPSQTEFNGSTEMLSCMEEDMDICDTPPHDDATTDAEVGRWFYLDHFGIEQGPSKLEDLKRLVERGILLSDHLIKHSDTDRWVTVENASSPLVPLNLPSIVSDVVTGMVNPPEAPGNSLGDFVDPNVEILSPIQLQEHQLNDVILSEPIEDLHIDERVETLLKGYNVTDGKELETIGEALNATFRHVEWENWSQSEGFTRFQLRSYEAFARQPDEGIRRNHELLPRECAEFKPSAIFGDQTVLNVCSDDWFAGRWSCKGGDWKRNDEAGSKKKVVLNQGYPLCQMPKCGHEDPRWCRRDDLYYPSRIKKIDLPSWAFSVSEDNGDCNSESSSVRSVSSKTLVPRGVKGTILPVVRINSRVIKDHGSFETQRTRGNERHSSRSAPFHSVFGDWNWNHEGSSSSRKMHERDSQSLNKCQTFPTIPQDRVCTVVELALNLGEWYYLDGTGHECGPFFLEELRDLVSKGKILENMSIFRKVDNTWVPISRNLVNHVSISGEQSVVTTENSSAIEPFHSRNADVHNNLSSFHCLHPQFIGYMRGKLHELVMKSFKNREFAAAISEVLDPWISKKQPKKEMDGHFPFNYSISRNSAIVAHELSADKLWKSDERPGKRARLLVDESDACSETDEVYVPKNDCSFEELWSESVFVDEHDKYNPAYDESWGFLSNHILARVFHFLKSDMNALTSSSVTCKRWNDAVKFYKSICRHVDLSAFGSNCSDNMFRSIMVGYDKRKLMSLVLTGCSNISANLLEEVLQVYPSITTVFIKGCNQFNELKAKLESITWLKHNRSQRNNDESHANIRSLKLMTEKNYFASRGLKSSGIYLDDSDSGDFGNHCTTFRHGFYKRAKIPDGRKSSSILSRDAQMRNWMHRKTETGYRKLEEYVTLRLKSIMKGNSYEFFTTKVTEIEDRMRRGYYVRHGSGSLKDDIIRMCRDAFKAKNYGDGKEMKHIFMSLIRLARSVEHNPMLNNAKDGTMKNFKDGSEAGLYSSKHKRRQNKVLNERKGKSNQIPSTNGGVDSGAFDREIGRKLFKLKNRNVNSDSETSDDHDHYFSEDDDRGEDESTASDTESDLDTHSSIGTVDSKGHGYFMIDDTLEAITDDREWGARMTKASLVPPITRKYEVIDKYLIVADEEEVQRKMRVALPDDYSERLLAQKSGIEESDMEIPEVKEYKPRKQLGLEVLEQEVYGIDPYTHNLLLDSMPADPEWSLVDKHRFIEEVLLRVLNEQVRHFTGSGSTPMLFSLKPVVEEILTTAEEDGDKRVVRLSQAILKAINSRLDDNYVAYRKGLGVVCNKVEGFGEDDFVVEFLGEVYPSWKWFEKQDGIRSLQKNSQEPAPEFYNIYLERPKGDCDGYDLVVVDAMHKANYASRICHSCRPNCEAKVTAVDGHYQIGIYSLRPIRYGEEITFDYNSVTESKEEYEASVCLCGSHVCRGSFLNLIGEGAFQKVLMACHGILDRHKLILEACVANSVSQEDYIELGRAGLGTCLLEGLPRWLIAYSANLVRFMNFERTKLPDEILKHNVEEKKKFFSEICLEVEKSDSEIQAEGVYNSRLQNMALTLDKVKYVMRRVFGDPKKAPPPIKKIDQEELVSVLWKGEGSLVEELLQSMSPHIETDLLTDLKFKIHSRDPSGSDNIQRELRRSLLWLRDELRNLPCTPKCRHDAAADLIHMYAYTKNFFKVIEYRSVTSPPVYISPLDLGPKYVNKMGSGFQEYCKTYGENYCLGQLIYWHSQNNADPDSRLARARKGCLSLPDVSSFYGKSQKPVHERVYDSRTVRFMLSRMEKQPQRPWPKDRIWLFKSNPGFFGSPMLDAVLNKCPLDKEMVQWLKSRPNVYQGT